MARFDPHSYTNPEQGSVSHLALRLNVDFEKQTLAGTATLVFPKNIAGPLDLDTRGLTIQKVADQDGKALTFKLEDPEGFMGSRLVVERTKETTAVVVSYQTSPEASALQWLQPGHTAGGQHPFLFSQCQPHHARSIVPIQDSPRVRFSYEAELTVPEPLAAVMSAAPGDSKPGAQPGTTVFRFRMPQAIPAYLLALAVGDIAYTDVGPRSRVYAEPKTLDGASWEFAQVDQMLTIAEGLFGIYLWDRFDFIVMPPAFPYGGMENPRLTFLTPTTIAGDRSLVNVLAHELAHSWTGNLVTNATMNDFWLNEGFTVWAERRIIEAKDGVESASLAAAVGRNALEEALKRFGPDSPYTCLLNNLEGVDPDEVYSMVPYEKGYLFVLLMEQTLGRREFDNFVRKYIDHFKFTSITTQEFEAFVEKEQPGLLKKINADAWIRSSGLPDNCPQQSSARLKTIEKLAAGFTELHRPTKEQTQKWTADEWQIFLAELPDNLEEPDCNWLESTFKLNQSDNAEILCKWLEIAASSGYEPSFEKIDSFLGSVGRMKFLKPIYQKLFINPDTKQMALDTFAKYKDRYHPIARAGLENILKQ